MAPPEFVSTRAFPQVPAPDEPGAVPCLSVRQPYAWLIVNGIKPVENRTWPTRFRGRILIHASANYPKRDYDDDRKAYHDRWGVAYPNRDELVGGIVGSATVVDCVTAHPSEWWVGPYGFVLEKPRAFAKLIPFKGALGIFNVPVSIVRAVGEMAEGNTHAN
jgi:hypothetical protein